MNNSSPLQASAEAAQYSKMAGKAVLSIIYFIGMYFLLVIAALGLTALFIWLGLILIIAKPMVLTFLLGAGIGSVGIIVTIFLFKFIFSKHVEDRSHLKEIKREQEPMLFELIDEVVAETGTQFPKKVYLATDVNAAVFYDSSFWSMFFPVKKNLQVGVALMNSVSVTEFRAILAHEFGHFSQKSMAIGSYVYTINRVIYNMLYDNSSFEQLAEKWNNVSGTFSIFVQFAFRIVEGIQWILKKMYNFVNLSYMGLSREMEFQADKVAAMVAGSAPTITLLQRLEIADYAFNSVIEYYIEKYEDSVCTRDIFSQHRFVYTFLSVRNGILLQDGLPMPTSEDLKRYNKSKLIIKNSWASHPDTEDRVQRLRILNIPARKQDNRLALTLLRNQENTSCEITAQVFPNAEQKGEIKLIDLHEFEKIYQERFDEASFDPLFNNYFNHRHLATDAGIPGTPNIELKDLFSDAVMDKVYTLNALKTDLTTLKEINKGEAQVKKFIYDGLNYKADDCPTLISSVNKELENLEKELANHDQQIYLYFKSSAERKGVSNKFSTLFDTLKRLDTDFTKREQFYRDTLRDTDFVNHTTPYDVIERNFKNFEVAEQKLKTEIGEILKDAIYGPAVSETNKKNFETYLQSNLVYFSRPEYNADNLGILAKAIHGYFETVDKGCFRFKKEILNFCAGLAACGEVRQAEGI